MSARTHTSYWRKFLIFAPALGVAAIVAAAAQGERDMAVSLNVYLILAPVALAGWAMAWRIASVLAGTPVTTIAQSEPGFASLRGKALALPNREPLLSPGGTPCVWYSYYSHQAGVGSIRGHTTASDSPLPFVLDDGSGQCIVYPEGAEISGGKRTEAGERRETMIFAGDTVCVAGQFAPYSGIQKAVPEQPAGEPLYVSVAPDPNEDRKQADARGTALLDAARAARQHAAATAGPLPALPSMAAPPMKGLFVISTRDIAGEAGWYGLLTKLNFAILALALGMAAYLYLHSH
jgi:hypothetical protein